MVIFCQILREKPAVKSSTSSTRRAARGPETPARNVPRTGESLLDSLVERFDGFDNLLRCEPAEFGRCRFHMSP